MSYRHNKRVKSCYGSVSSAYVRYWHLADINLSAPMSAFAVAFGGKADMPFCIANVGF